MKATAETLDPHTPADVLLEYPRLSTIHCPLDGGILMLRNAPQLVLLCLGHFSRTLSVEIRLSLALSYSILYKQWFFIRLCLPER